MIFCKINDGTNIIVKIVPKMFYQINSQTEQINILHKQFLKSLNYLAGDFSLSYYVTYNEALFNSVKLIIDQISSNGLESKCFFSKFVNKQIIQLFEQQHSNSKLIAFTGNYLQQIVFYKYNYFSSRYILKFNQKTRFVKNDSFNLYLMQYERIDERYKLILQQEKSNEDNALYLPLPSRFYLNYENKAITNVTLNSFLDLQNYQYNSPLVISAMLNENNYNINNPNQYVHFGSLYERFVALANKYYLLYDTAKSSYYNQTYSRVASSEILKSLDTFERSQLYRAGLLKVNSETTSIIDLVDYTSSQFSNWLTGKLNTSSAYDAINQHKLISLLPQNVLSQERNQDLFKFVNFMGNSFDEIWAAIKNIARIHSLFETSLESFTNQFLWILLKQNGINFNLSFNNSTLQLMYLQYSTITQQKLSINEYNKFVMSRLLSNIHFLNRAKGTRNAIEQILNIFGLSSNLINVIQLSPYNNQNNSFYPVIKKSLNGECNIEINLFSLNEFVIINFKPNYITINDEILNINNKIITYFDFDIQFDSSKEYSLVLRRTLFNNLIIEIYKSTQLLSCIEKLHEKSGFNITINNSLINKIKYIINLQFDNKYVIGNVFYNFINIDTAVDFNANNPIIHSGNMIVNYNINDIQVSLFDQQEYSSIFSLGNSPRTFYQIDTPLSSFDTINLSFNNTQQPNAEIKTKNEIKNIFSNVFIGARYSNFFSNQFMFSLNQPINNLLDNSTNDEYISLKEYRKRYQSFFDTSNNYTYYDLVKLYEQLDGSVFNVIKSFVPYTINSHFGVMLDNNLLYRNKIKTITFTQSITNKKQPNVIQNMNESYNFFTLYQGVSNGKIFIDDIQKLNLFSQKNIFGNFNDLLPKTEINTIINNLISNNISLIDKNILSNTTNVKYCETSLSLINNVLIIRQDKNNPLEIINHMDKVIFINTCNSINNRKSFIIAESYDIQKHTIPEEYKIIIQQSGLQITK